MINSRNLDELDPKVKELAEALIAACLHEGIDLLITSTYRDYEAQNALYAQGRKERGHVVTNAQGGYSYHNFRLAFDVVPLIKGKPVWNTMGLDLKLWRRIGELGKGLGLEWGGDWVDFREFPHFQYTGGFTLAQLRQEYNAKKVAAKKAEPKTA